MFVTLLGIFTHVNHLLIKAAVPILRTLCPPIVDGITIFFGPFISSYHVIVPLLLSKVKYDSSVGLAEHVVVTIHGVAYTILDHSLSQLKVAAFTLYQYVRQFVRPV